MIVIQNIISAISAIIFAASVTVAYFALQRARMNQREATARSIFNDYLKVAIQYPSLAFPEKIEEKFDFDKKTIGESSDDFERYEWFVSLMIFSMREILDIFGEDTYWKQTARRQISYHMQYIRWRYRIKMFNFVLLAGENVNRIVLELGVNDATRRAILDQLPINEKELVRIELWKKILGVKKKN